MTGDDLGTPHLRFERDGAIAWCVIDRPGARNAFTSAMYLGIGRAVDLVNASRSLAALIITGVGDVFAPGGDMAGRREEGEEDLSHLGTRVLPFDAVRDSAKPVISAVNGLCQGGALTIAMLSDVAVASDRATFRGPELLRGVADMYYAALLPAHVGVARARDIMMTARRLTAEEAVACGLVARMVPHDQLRQAAVEVAADILQTAPEARLHFKRAVNAGYGTVDHMTFASSIRSAECAEGFSAFVERRAPSWVPPEFRKEQRL